MRSTGSARWASVPIIDDFGTGYASLGHLKKLRVTGIKIHKSFVSQMSRDENDAVIVRSTIDLGHISDSKWSPKASNLRISGIVFLCSAATPRKVIISVGRSRWRS